MCVCDSCVVLQACACIEALHLVLLLVIHRYGPPYRKRLIVVLLSHGLFILTYLLLYYHLDGLWVERRFDLIHGLVYVMLQVAFGKTVQEGWWRISGRLTQCPT